MVKQAKKSSIRPRAVTSRPVTLGLAAFEKISAIEGIFLSEASRTFLQDLDQSSLSIAEKRDAILKRHQKLI